MSDEQQLFPRADPGTAAIIGHRGVAADCPENTLCSVVEAWRQGADAVEIDVHLTADGHLLSIHDANTLRTTGVDRQVSQSSLVELQQLNAGQWKSTRFTGERLPSLEQVLETVPAGKRLVVEVKCGPEAIAPLEEILRRQPTAAGSLLLISFQLEVLAAARARLPQLAVAPVFDLKRSRDLLEDPAAISQLVEQACQSGWAGLDFGPPELLMGQQITPARQAGLDVLVWTVNDSQQAHRLTGLGVTGLTTDRPGALRRELSCLP